MAVERLDTGSFEEVIQSLADAIDKFSTVRENLEAKTDNLLDDWTGDSRESFKNAYDTLKLYMSNEYDMLEVMKQDLTSIKESYEGWDNEIKNKLAEATGPS